MRAVFFDRDGTLMEDTHYCGDPALVRVYPGVREALRRLRAEGWLVIVVTNQSGIGRGYFSEEQYHAVEAELNRQLGANLLDATYYCPDRPEAGSPRRKPSPEMVLEAARDHHLDLARSFFVGDKAIDIECGKNAGVRTILVQTGYGMEERDCAPDWIAHDICEAAQLILAQKK